MKQRSQIPLTALRAFEAAARHCRLQPACDELLLTPGAVSQQVRSLEQRFDVQLFDRARGRYELTPLGKSLATRLTRCFDDLELAVGNLAATGDPHRLRLKVTPAFDMRWLTPRLASFAVRHPDIDLQRAAACNTANPDLGDCDFALRRGLPPWSDADPVFLFRDEPIAVCSPEVASVLVSTEDLCHAKLLHSAAGEDNWNVWLESADLDPAWARFGITFADAAMACEAAARWGGVAITQRQYVLDELSSGALVCPFDRHVSSGSGYYLVSSTLRRREKKIRAFRSWLEELPDFRAAA